MIFEKSILLKNCFVIMNKSIIALSFGFCLTVIVFDPGWERSRVPKMNKSRSGLALLRLVKKKNSMITLL